MEPKINLNVKTEEIKSLREVVLGSIRQAIVTGKLKPGQQLKERELALAIGTSTTPVKEALRILSHEGLVETFPRKGTFVSEGVHTSIKEIFMLRANLDSLLARLAALKVTKEELMQLENQISIMENLVKKKSVDHLKKENTNFHMMIRKAAKNPVIFQMIMNVVAYDEAFRDRTYEHEEEIEAGFNDHRLVYEAIRAGDENLSEERMKSHILRSVERVLEKEKKKKEN
ncbi:GntR family transcriptional regulator [Domibacillus robiginosus]|uniref:GntR family transcriptional regulator n=1 Tax=Domibacillus robiginosus TaxID=1071054 RepID=UPI00067BD122|nr:GntR family transcriptional regulator [Domibacillus robiginosus]